jgi:hypothetical protein
VITPMRRMPEFRQLLSAEIHRRLGAGVGQVLQAAAAAAGQHQRHRTPRKVQALGHIDGFHGVSGWDVRNKITKQLPRFWVRIGCVALWLISSLTSEIVIQHTDIKHFVRKPSREPGSMRFGSFVAKLQLPASFLR